MTRWVTLGFRLAISALLIVIAAWGSMWAYVGYEAHRARLMLAEVSRVRVGDTEGSVLPLVQRFGGSKWTPEPLPPKQWLDKEEYDYQKNRVSDYKYELGLSSFGTTSGWTSRWTQALRAVSEAVPTRLQPTLGMRDWGAGAELSIRGGHVQSVSAMTIFVGHSEVLGHSWELAEGMPRFGMPAKAYAIGASHLTMSQGSGTMIDNFLTPKASEEEVEVARHFNANCRTSIVGCKGLCDVAPRALEYLKRHPDAAWNIIPPKCP